MESESVILTQWVHPFPYRTRKLSAAVVKILGWRRPGKIAHSRHLWKGNWISFPFASYSSLAQSVERVILVITGKSNRGHQKYGLGFVKSVIFLLSSVGSADRDVYTKRLCIRIYKIAVWLWSNCSYSSLAQSVERMTVNHDVVGSSPTGGAI